MNGGDCIHGMHLLPNKTVIEVINPGFENAGAWLNEFKYRLEPVINFKRLTLPGKKENVFKAWNKSGKLPVSRFIKALKEFCYN